MNSTDSAENNGDVQLMRNRMFAGLRSEFYNEMGELRSELSGEIYNTSRNLVSCHNVCCVNDSFDSETAVY